MRATVRPTLSSSEPAAATELPPHTARQRSTGRPWPKGTSGNATGKAKRLPDPGELARRHVRSAIRALVRALAGPDQQAAVAAATTLLNQGFGLPNQHLALGLPRLSLFLHAPPDDGETPRANGEARAWNA